MNAVVTELRKVGASATKSSTNAGDEIKSRYSQELVLALGGPVGSGVSLVQEVLSESLRAHGYAVVHVKVSSYFKKFAADLNSAESQNYKI